ncbi:MAG: acyl-CoA carboxylase subunit beta [Chloroflexi bacterium]|nr:acyl-CoA carboxylase subunit beta [Chloroflexota bacterium]
MGDYLSELQAVRAQAEQGGGPARIAAQHARGKLTARERVALLLDDGSFQEMGALVTHNVTDFGMADQKFSGDGVVTGFGTVGGRRVAVFAQDFTVLGGSFSAAQAIKIGLVQDLALESGIPLVGLLDSGGARIQEGVRSLAAYGAMFNRHVQASGVIPQFSIMLGPCAGGSVYSPALTDFVIMTQQNAYMFVTGPEVVKTVTGEEVTHETLGGAEIHATTSGVAHFVADDERSALALVGRILGYLPQNNTEDPPRAATPAPAPQTSDALDAIAALGENESYDVHAVIDAVFDRDSFLEVQAAYAQNVVVGFGRLDGYPTGVVANQPSVMAGVLDINASDKIGRFVRLCDAFNIPVVTLVDCPGFLPGVAQEYDGLIRHGAKIIYAYCEATVPKISVIMRKAMGGAYIAMSSRRMRSDLAYAWPTAQIAVMGAEGAVRILRRKELSEANDPAALERAFVDEYREKFFNPYSAAAMGQIDEVIAPHETRGRLIRALGVLRSKVQQNPPKKHGLMPV